MVSSIFILSAVAAVALAQQPGDMIHGKNITQLGDGVYSANNDGSFTFLGGGQGGSNGTASSQSTPDATQTATPKATAPSRLLARSSVYPGKVTCDGAEGAVDQYDLNNAALDFEGYCGTQHEVDGNSYAFAKSGQAMVYMCEQGSKNGHCKTAEIKVAVAQIGAACPGVESGWSGVSSWYKTYGYKVASDAKVCGKVPS